MHAGNIGYYLCIQSKFIHFLKHIAVRKAYKAADLIGVINFTHFFDTSIVYIVISGKMMVEHRANFNGT